MKIPARSVRAHQLAVEARNLTKVYRLYPSATWQLLDLLGVTRLTPGRNFAEHVALSGVDFVVTRGERVGIIGRNGAGKSTLLKLITGAASPTVGSLTVNGEVQALMHVGLGFHPEFTGRENIRASLLYIGFSGRERTAAEQDIIDFCELGEYIDQPLKTYSLGMQTRLQFACATAVKPDILVIDEILGAGDAYFSVKSWMRMQRLTQSGCTLLLVSHSMPQILQFCDRCIWIEAGGIYLDSKPRDVVCAYEAYMERMSDRLGSGARDLSLPDRPGPSLRLAVSEVSLPAKTSTAPDADATIKPLVEHLADGQAVLRWPARAGPKLHDFGLYLDDGVRTTRFAEGSEVEFRFTVINEVEAVNCRYQITVFSLDNRRITRLLSPVDTFDGISKGHQVRMALSPCLLNAGEYYINLAILPHDALRTGAPLERFDLVASFYDFEVTRTLDYRDRCVFTHPAQWTIGASKEPVTAPHGLNSSDG